MVRKLAVKGAIEKTKKRKLSDKLNAKKKKLHIECFWSVFDQPPYEETEIE